MEESPVGGHHAKSVAEKAVKNAQGQFRVLKNALESRINRRVEGEYQAAPWMVMFVATVINKGRKDDEEFTPHRRWRGKELSRPVAEFGECVM